MGGMDLSDVGYDAFLINGKRDLQLVDAKPGERIRLRIINAAASSYFYVSMGIPIAVIAADGIDVQPVVANEILIGMAETYDVLFTVPELKNYELRATAQDVTGFASAWIGSGEEVRAPNKPLPDFYASMDHNTHAGHNSQAGHDKHGGHDMHAGHGAPIESLTVDALTAIESTALPKDAKVHELKLSLGGDMERYIWHINGKAIFEDRLILINKGEVVRFTFENQTMMHHPMHLHGHFFRVLGDKGDKNPLKHTVDVPPHASRTIEFYANEPGQWMLHCHNLYHMETGMARVIRYNDYKMPPEMAMHDKHDPHVHQHLYTHTQLEAASNHAQAKFRLIRTWDELDLEVESASIDGDNFDYGKKWETEGDALYKRWFTNYFHAFGGAEFYDEEVFGQAGIGYVLPLLIESSVAVNHEGKFRFELEKRFQWTKQFFTDADFTWRLDRDGERDSEFEVSLMYGPSWTWAAGLMFTEKNIGLGAQVQF